MNPYFRQILILRYFGRTLIKVVANYRETGENMPMEALQLTTLYRYVVQSYEAGLKSLEKPKEKVGLDYLHDMNDWVITAGQALSMALFDKG